MGENSTFRKARSPLPTAERSSGEDDLFAGLIAITSTGRFAPLARVGASMSDWRELWSEQKGRSRYSASPIVYAPSFRFASRSLSQMVI
ncbi:MAG: hypothetical protein CME06_14380 [Gemmatimonadetes bacterium]|nr:hypothetical protein [Gemmatimonadota bacterium]